MARGNSDYSERKFQDHFVAELQKYKWEAPTQLDGTKRKVTVSDLITHWRGELNRINADQLEGVPLSDNEFAQVMAKVGQIANSYEAAKVLAIEESKGKIDGIYRDNHPGITREQITLTIFKKAEVRGGDSTYRIAREVETPFENRFDLILLINGLPLINIEQKRTDQTLNEAFGQFLRYYRDGEYTHNFMAFSQMMIITSDIDTRYFATPKSAKDFNLSFVFRWSDKNNKPITKWEKVIEHFLMIPMAHQMVGDYLVIDEAKEEENRRHMLMRPYQVYALQAVEAAAFGWDNDDVAHGGYVWHTTGSGKTITSFKTALFLSTRGGFDKVVFLVDRRELDNRTSENFKAYAAYEAVSVDDTKRTSVLKRQLENPKSGIVVTTTFKLNSLVKELVEASDYRIANKKIIFIIDEAHRTTMGQMMGTIKEYFKKNGLFYGFTGTPLFDENEVKGMVNEKSELINTTEKLFGPKLHQYTIDEAIADGNVLGFHVDYINTGEFIGYEDLQDKLIEKISQEKPDLGAKEIARQVHSWDKAELERQALTKGLLIYQDETHIPRVVEEILVNWESQSRNREFNAILTVAIKERVIAYYHEFQKQMKERGIHLNVAITFSFGNENDPDATPPEQIAEMFRDYGSFTGIEFVAGDKKHGESAYFEDIVERATRGGSGRNPKNIDLVIVAEQLLTGYDSKRLNTLYVDRRLQLQGLIQAYSRTNRIFGKTKEFGSIINFQLPAITEQSVNRALELYGSGGKSSRAIVDTYPTSVEKFAILAEAMREILPDPTDWASIEHDLPIKKEFLKAFRDASDQLNLVMQYYEYSWDDTTFGIDEHNWLRYVGAYKNLKPKGEESITDVIPLEGKTKLAGTQVIDAAHILSLIGAKVNTDSEYQKVDSETLRIIHEQIQELSDMGEHEQAVLIKEFVDTELVVGHVESSIHFDVAFDRWKLRKRNHEIYEFSENWGIQENALLESVEAYERSKPDVVPFMDELARSVDFENAKDQTHKSQLRHIMALNGELPKWMAEIKIKYD